jgi:HK97 family phage prohead protease
MTKKSVPSDKRVKLYQAVIKSVDEATKTIRFKVSDDSVDRYGEKVDQKWDLKNFKKNPVFIWNHKGGYDLNPEDVLGTWSDFKTESDGSYATANFDEGNPNAMFVFGQYMRGILRAVSVGFIPHTINWEDDTPVLTDNELLEISAVAIPANANAVALAFKSGQMERKDALYLMKEMQSGAKQLEQQLKEAPEGQENNMEEVIKKLDEALTGIGELTTKVAEYGEKLDAVSTEVEGLKAEKEDTSKVTDEPAKGGENDQPGAGEEEVEIDEDAELTEEQQAEFEAELAEQLKEGDSEE